MNKKNAQNARKYWIYGKRGCKLVAKMCCQFVAGMI